MSDSHTIETNQYDQNCNSFVHNEVDINEIEVRTHDVDSIEQNENKSVAQVLLDLPDSTGESIESRRVKNLKAKLDRVVSLSKNLKETLYLDHAKLLEKYAEECKNYSIKISEVERKNIRLEANLTCAKNTHKHQVSIMKEANTTRV